jgi:hypothetical protein
MTNESLPWDEITTNDAQRQAEYAAFERDLVLAKKALARSFARTKRHSTPCPTDRVEAEEYLRAVLEKSEHVFRATVEAEAEQERLRQQMGDRLDDLRAKVWTDVRKVIEERAQREKQKILQGNEPPERKQQLLVGLMQWVVAETCGDVMEDPRIKKAFDTPEKLAFLEASFTIARTYHERAERYRSGI